MVSILDTGRCPHCKADVPAPTPRVCPECAGSLQKRYLKAGCVSSGPALLMLLVSLAAALALAVGRT